MTMQNSEVISKFVAGDSNKTGSSTKSRGGKLYSYNAVIAEWDGDRLVIHDGWDGYSPTTSKHFAYLRGAIDRSDVDWVPSHEPDKGNRVKERWTKNW